MFFYLIYVSSAVTPYSQSALRDLLSACQRNNLALGITGLLLYKDGNFMQALEGDESVVRALYEKVCRNPRHQGILVLLEGSRKERQFPSWSMGFRDLNDPQILLDPAYSEFLNSPLSGDEFSSDPSRCQKLMMMFKKNM